MLAPFTLLAVKVAVVPTQGAFGPVTVGAFGVLFGLTDWQAGTLLPQTLSAVAHTSPLPLPTVTVIELVPWPLTMVQPLGTDQV